MYYLSRAWQPSLTCTTWKRILQYRWHLLLELFPTAPLTCTTWHISDHIVDPTKSYLFLSFSRCFRHAIFVQWPSWKTVKKLERKERIFLFFPPRCGYLHATYSSQHDEFSTGNNFSGNAIRRPLLYRPLDLSSVFAVRYRAGWSASSFYHDFRPNPFYYCRNVGEGRERRSSRGIFTRAGWKREKKKEKRIEIKEVPGA